MSPKRYTLPSLVAATLLLIGCQEQSTADKADTLYQHYRQHPTSKTLYPKSSAETPATHRSTADRRSLPSSRKETAATPDTHAASVPRKQTPETAMKPQHAMPPVPVEPVKVHAQIAKAKAAATIAESVAEVEKTKARKYPSLAEKLFGNENKKAQ